MKITFDDKADALYLQLKDEKVVGNRKVDEKTILDLDRDNNVVGIELLDAENRFKDLRSFSLDFAGSGSSTSEKDKIEDRKDKKVEAVA